MINGYVFNNLSLLIENLNNSTCFYSQIVNSRNKFPFDSVLTGIPIFFYFIPFLKLQQHRSFTVMTPLWSAAKDQSLFDNEGDKKSFSCSLAKNQDFAHLAVPKLIKIKGGEILFKISKNLILASMNSNLR